MTAHDVIFNSRTVGRAQLYKDGLYLHVSVRCHDLEKKFYRLWMFSGIKKIDLGLCLYESNSFLWDKKVAVKEIEEGNLRFEMQLVEHPPNNKFVPVLLDCTFPCFTAIHNSFFGIQNGVKGLYINVNCSSSRD